MSHYPQIPAELDPGPSRAETIVGISAAVLTLAMFGGLMMLFS